LIRNSFTETKGEEKAMKRTHLIASCVFLLCSLLLLVNTATTNAAEPGYERISYAMQVLPTIDGKWTSPTEWTDGGVTMIGQEVAFRSKWDFGDVVTTRFVVEFFSDTTNDTGDYWQMCLDGDQSGGTAPQSGDYKFEIRGHTNLVWYQGNGTGWTQIAPGAGEIEWANSISASPPNSTPHWILEFNKIKNAGTIQLGILWNFRLAAYDASNPSAGVKAWPPTSPDVPNGWGIENYTSDPIPESLSLGVVVLLSSAALIVGSVYLRKRPKTTTLTPMRL
jgi:hypothetical protein